MNAAQNFEKTRKQARRFDSEELAVERDRKGKRNRTVRGNRQEWEAL